MTHPYAHPEAIHTNTDTKRVAASPSRLVLRETTHLHIVLSGCVCCGPAAAGAVYVFVFDKKGRLLIQRRSPNKKIGPGQWDLSVAEHLSQGELTC